METRRRISASIPHNSITTHVLLYIWRHIINLNKIKKIRKRREVRGGAGAGEDEEKKRRKSEE